MQQLTESELSHRPDHPLPAQLEERLEGYHWTRVLGAGDEDDAVFRLKQPHHAGLHLKTAAADDQRSLWQESRRLEWLGERLPVPHVRLYLEDSGREYLLTS